MYPARISMWLLGSKESSLTAADLPNAFLRAPSGSTPPRLLVNLGGRLAIVALLMLAWVP